MEYLIKPDNFALVPSSADDPVITNTLTLLANGWSSNRQGVSVDTGNFPLKMFQINTINIPPADMSKWAANGVYAASDDALAQKIYFNCATVPSEDLTFTVTQTPTGRIGDFIGTGNTLTGYAGSATVVHIPNGVREIAANVFRYDTELLSVYLGEYTYEIGNGAFEGCTSLSTVVFYYPIEITTDMFNGCTAVTDIVFDTDNGTWARSIDLTFTSQISGSCLDAIVDKLYDYSGGTMHTLKIGATNKARMSAAQITAAQVKNWTVI